MKRFWDRPERLFDALVIGIAIPTVTVAAMSSNEWDEAKRDAARPVAAQTQRDTGSKAAPQKCKSLARSGNGACVAAMTAQYNR